MAGESRAYASALSRCSEWRRAANWRGALSFSAGIDRHNAPDAVACGFIPVTTCSDLLKLGGYGRLPEYLTGLFDRMKSVGAVDHDDFLLRAEGFGRQAIRETLDGWSRAAAQLPADAIMGVDPSPSREQSRPRREESLAP